MIESTIASCYSYVGKICALSDPELLKFVNQNWKESCEHGILRAWEDACGLFRRNIQRLSPRATLSGEQCSCPAEYPLAAGGEGPRSREPILDRVPRRRRGGPPRATPRPGGAARLEGRAPHPPPPPRTTHARPDAAPGTPAAAPYATPYYARRKTPRTWVSAPLVLICCLPFFKIDSSRLKTMISLIYGAFSKDYILYADILTRPQKYSLRATCGPRAASLTPLMLGENKIGVIVKPGFDQ
ncbi:hypothetical protein TNCV_3339181 [Trichonephila clavipes]|nr:hypothetical protein TNCV_3339181 [Trichonephila clavipes]